MARLNLVYEFGGFALCRDQVKPSPRDHQIRGQSQNPVSNGVAVMVIIEEPCVDIPLAQRSLYGRKVHGQTTILTTSGGLGESGLEPTNNHAGTAAPAVRPSETRQS